MLLRRARLIKALGWRAIELEMSSTSALTSSSSRARPMRAWPNISTTAVLARLQISCAATNSSCMDLGTTGTAGAAVGAWVAGWVPQPRAHGPSEGAPSRQKGFASPSGDCRLSSLHFNMVCPLLMFFLYVSHQPPWLEQCCLTFQIGLAALIRATTRPARSSGRNFARKSSAPTFLTMAWLKPPDREVCSTICNLAMRGSPRISAVRV